MRVALRLAEAEADRARAAFHLDWVDHQLHGTFADWVAAAVEVWADTTPAVRAAATRPAGRRSRFTAVRLPGHAAARLAAAVEDDRATGGGTAVSNAGWCATAVAAAVARTEARHGSLPVTPAPLTRAPLLVAAPLTPRMTVLLTDTDYDQIKVAHRAGQRHRNLNDWVAAALDRHTRLTVRQRCDRTPAPPALGGRSRSFRVPTSTRAAVLQAIAMDRTVGRWLSTSAWCVDALQAEVATPADPHGSHRPPPDAPATGRVSVWMDRAGYDDLRAAYLADWAQDHRHDTLGRWVAAALERHLTRPRAVRDSPVAGPPAEPPQVVIPARTWRTFDVPARTVDAVDQARQGQTSRSRWAAAAIESAVHDARARHSDPLPAPPVRLPTRADRTPTTPDR